MKNYITIDGGTTNTRLTLVCDGICKDTRKISMGAGDCKDGNDLFKEKIKEAISQLLETHQLKEEEIERVLASGMITSEYGLCLLEHCVAPAGLKELREHSKEVLFPEITSIPFVFLPGVRVNGASLEEADLMRGEETELMGIGVGGASCAYLLPGSHSKMVLTDAEGRIVSFSTMLTGEMIAALSRHTILKSAIDLTVDTIEPSALWEGFSYCREHGINEALFKVRVLEKVFQADPIRRYNFFLGLILCDEILCLTKTSAEKFIIGGKKQLKEATAHLLGRVSDKEVICLSEEEVANSTAIGAMRIYEYQA